MFLSLGLFITGKITGNPDAGIDVLAFGINSGRAD